MILKKGLFKFTELVTPAFIFQSFLNCLIITAGQSLVCCVAKGAVQHGHLDKFVQHS